MNITEMNFILVLLLWLLDYSSAQVTANCDYFQNILADNTYYIYSPNYPRYYSPGQQCRWIALCPPGYNCRLVCPEIRLPQSASCSLDRLVVSLTGDPNFYGQPQTYCGSGSLDVTSTGQQISFALYASQNSPGGRLNCTVRAQIATPAPSCICGVRRQNRIVGGQETGVNEYPMLAGLADRRIVQIKCGATIITPLYVLSAAHCVKDQAVSNYAVIVGEHNVTYYDSPATAAYVITEFIIHPSYTASNYDYDISLVKVGTEITFGERVLPACLPFKFASANYDFFAGKKVTLLGWGTLSFGGLTSSVPRKVDLDVLSQTACKSAVVTSTDRQMCTYTRGKDSCQDDSGGPGLYTDPATGLLFSVGIISYGKACASESPGILTRVTSLLNWITTNAPYKNYCVK